MYSTDSYAPTNAGTTPPAVCSAKPARYARFYSSTSPEPIIAKQNCRASVSVPKCVRASQQRPTNNSLTSDFSSLTLVLTHPFRAAEFISRKSLHDFPFPAGHTNWE